MMSRTASSVILLLSFSLMEGYLKIKNTLCSFLGARKERKEACSAK